MSKNNSHLDDAPSRSASQDNRISNDSSPREVQPNDRQHQATVDDFDEEGMGVAPKE